jgi:hypothetical protein
MLENRVAAAETTRLKIAAVVVVPLGDGILTAVVCAVA